jgi:hypothetical protein
LFNSTVFAEPPPTGKRLLRYAVHFVHPLVTAKRGLLAAETHQKFGVVHTKHVKQEIRVKSFKEQPMP